MWRCTNTQKHTEQMLMWFSKGPRSNSPTVTPTARAAPPRHTKDLKGLAKKACSVNRFRRLPLVPLRAHYVCKGQSTHWRGFQMAPYQSGQPTHRPPRLLINWTKHHTARQGLAAAPGKARNRQSTRGCNFVQGSWPNTATVTPTARATQKT